MGKTQDKIDAHCDAVTKGLLQGPAATLTAGMPFTGADLGELARAISREVGCVVVIVPTTKRMRVGGQSIEVSTVMGYPLPRFVGDPSRCIPAIDDSDEGT